jgi:mycothiol synthase
VNLELRQPASLNPEQADAVLRLIARAPDSADNPPLGEHARFGLRAGFPVRHSLALLGPDAVGYAQLSPDGAGASLELVADSVELASRVVGAFAPPPDPDTRLWAHGVSSTAAAFAQRHGWVAIRTLHQLRRSIDSSIDSSEAPPHDIAIRPFRPGADDQRWLALNAKAFAGHREQGHWTQHELSQRIAADWFDPDGFLLAVRGDQLLGFHWTKIHRLPGGALGEVYVLGIDPQAQGMKLGSYLLRIGLEYLRSRAVSDVMLYVDEDNRPALSLYLGQGFTVHSTDFQYAMSPV